MEILDLGKAVERRNVAAGTVIVRRGSEDRAVVVLHAGIAEILSGGESADGADPDRPAEDSVRIGFAKGETILGSLAVPKEGEANPFGYRTVTDCVLSVRPADSAEMTELMRTDASFALKVHRSLVSAVETCFYLFRNDRYLWHKVASIADSLALARGGTAKSAPPGSADRRSSSLEGYAAFLKSGIESAGLPLPKAWDYNLFLGRLQDRLDLYAERDAETIESHIDMKQYAFAKRLLKKGDEAVSAVLSGDEPLNRYLLDFLGATHIAMMRANEGLVREIRTLLERLYAADGWTDRIVAAGEKGGREAENFLHFLAKFSLRFRKDAINLLGLDPLTTFPAFASLGRFRDFKDVPEVPAAPGKDTGGRLGKYEGLLGKILDFAEVPAEFREEFTGLVDFLAGGRELRSPDRVGEMYWELYERCFLKTVGTDLKGFVPGIMLHFGVVDERLLSEEALAAVDGCYASALFTDETVPVMTLPYFLEKIYKGEVNPSVTEMGDTFGHVLKLQKRMTPKEKAAAFIYHDVHDDRVRFELRKVASDLGGMLFGNRKKALPFLTDAHLGGNPGRMFVEPEKIVEAVGEYRRRDFSMFHRQVILRHKLGTDFVQKEVAPNFVLYPCFGSRAVMWQEMDGTGKKTPGRIFFPVFFSEKLEEALVEQIAYFRWELQKAIAGHEWTDPVEGGLAGAYYDYIAFYRKNPKISPEAKQRLTEFIKRTKSDKDRFAKDYATWVDYEFFGRMRLNPAAREIFYRFCPFPAEVRDEMSKKPVFAAMATRFHNRREKERTKIEAKLKRYGKKMKSLPEDLEEYLAFLDM